MEPLIGLISFFVFLLLGYFVGSWRERKHYKSIKKREKETLHIPVVSFKQLPEDRDVKALKLATGSVVISIDYFKRFLAGLINIFGGQVRPYESLVDRAKREAILRMKSKMEDVDMIVNFRIETSTIGGAANRGSVGSIEVLAYGTAVKFNESNEVRS